jgi:hypothetical protein
VFILDVILQWHISSILDFTAFALDNAKVPKTFELLFLSFLFARSLCVDHLLATFDHQPEKQHIFTSNGSVTPPKHVN